MARNKGTLPISANFEAQIAEPIDARGRVALKSDLTNPATWQAKDGLTYAYIGMPVSVYADPTTANNGIYRLNAADFTVATNWRKQIDEQDVIASYQKITDNRFNTTSKTVPGAVNEVLTIAHGAQKALSFDNYSDLVYVVSNFDIYDPSISIGQSLYVLSLNVPDLWLSDRYSEYESYTYTTDQALLADIQAGGGKLKIGYFYISILETEKAPRKKEIKLFRDNALLAVTSFSFMIDEDLNGWSVKSVSAYVPVASTSGTPTVTLTNLTTGNTITSTPVTIDANELTSLTAATPAVINPAYKSVATGNLLSVNLTVTGTGAKGLGVIIVFEKI